MNPYLRQPAPPGARWGEDGQIIEANRFHDLASFMKQSGLSE